MDECDTENYDYLVKIVVIGDSSVGKTNIINRLCNNTFDEHTNATVSCAFSSKQFIVEGKKLKLQIWDTCGQEKYRSITKSYFQHAKGVVVVFDVVNYSSFQNVNSWIETAHNTLGDQIPLTILGNKCDIEGECERKVEQYEIDGLGKKYSKNLFINFLDCDCFKSSALKNKNINYPFEKLAESKIIKFY